MTKSPIRLLAIGVLLLEPLFPAAAQVPNLISYQGVVKAGTTAFNGSGLFKLALVDPTGTTTFWSNDGTSVGGNEPTNAVTLAVADGLFSLLLGDTTLANMTAIPHNVFGNSDVRLRVWFSDGVNGFQVLAPAQRVAATGYAMRAATADAVSTAAVLPGSQISGAITVATLPTLQLTGTLLTTQLADGSVTADKLAANGCADNQTLKYTGGKWTCADDAGSAGSASGIVTGTTTVNVGATGMVLTSPAALGLPVDTLARNPVVLRASAWTGTAASMTLLLVASVGLFTGSGWPVRVYDPTGTFSTGAAVVELVVRLDPP